MVESIDNGTDPEVDEFGIPIKRKKSETEPTDEFGIPLKKKEPSAPSLRGAVGIGRDSKSVSPSTSSVKSPSVSAKNDQFADIATRLTQNMTAGGGIPTDKSPAVGKLDRVSAPTTLAEKAMMPAKGSDAEKDRAKQLLSQYKESLQPEIERAENIKSLEARQAEIDSRLDKIAKSGESDPSLNAELDLLNKQRETNEERLKFERLTLEDQWKAKTIPFASAYIQAGGNRIIEGLSKIPKGLGILMSSDNDVAEAIAWTIMPPAKAAWEAFKPKGATEKDNPAYQLGNIIDDWRKDHSHINPLVEDNFSYKMTTALAGDLPLYGATAAFGGPGAVSALGAMDNGVGEFEAAYEKTNDANTLDENQFIAKYLNEDGSNEAAAKKTYESLKNQNPNDVGSKMFLLAGAVGTLEGLPFVGWMNKVDRRTGGMFTKYFEKEGIKAFTKAMESNAAKPFVQGVEEAAQESISQLLTNASANQTYDKTRDVLEGLDDAASLGFGMGFVTGGLGSITTSLESKLAEAKNNQERAEIEKSLSVVSMYEQMLNSGKSVISPQADVAKKKVDIIEDKLAKGNLSEVQITALQEAKESAQSEYDKIVDSDFDKLATEANIIRLEEKAEAVADVAPEQAADYIKEAEALKVELQKEKAESKESLPTESTIVVEENAEGENKPVSTGLSEQIIEPVSEVVDDNSPAQTAEEPALEVLPTAQTEQAEIQPEAAPSTDTEKPSGVGEVDKVAPTSSNKAVSAIIKRQSLREAVKEQKPLAQKDAVKEARAENTLKINSGIGQFLSNEFGNVTEQEYPKGDKNEGKSEYKAKYGSFVLDVRPSKNGYQVFLGEPRTDVGGVESFGQVESWNPSNEDELMDVIKQAKALVPDSSAPKIDNTIEVTTPVETLPDIREVEGEVNQSVDVKKYAQQKEKIVQKRTEIRKRILDKQQGRLSAIPVDLLPDYVELASTYIQDGVLDAKEFIKRFKADNADLLEGVTDEDLTDVFEETLVDEMEGGAVKESKSKKTFDAANKSKNLAKKASSGAKYVTRTVEGEKEKADDLWRQIEENEKNEDDILYEAERVLMEADNDLNDSALGIFAIDLAQKLDNARNTPGKTLKEIQDYDDRAFDIMKTVQRQLSAAAATTRTLGVYQQRAFEINPAVALSAMLEKVSEANSERIGDLYEETEQGIVELLNKLKETETGKTAIDLFFEKASGRKKDRAAKYVSRKKAIDDTIDGFIDGILNNGGLNAIPIPPPALRLAANALKNGLKAGLSVAETVESAVETIRAYYKDKMGDGDTFDEAKATALFTDLYNRANEEANRRTTLTPEDAAKEAEAYEKAKGEALEKKVREKMLKDAEVLENKEREAVMKAEEKRKKKEEKLRIAEEKKSQNLSDSEQKEQDKIDDRINKIGEKILEIDRKIDELEDTDRGRQAFEKYESERDALAKELKKNLDERKKTKEESITDAQRELNEAILAERKAEQSLKTAVKRRAKIEKLSGNDLRKFIYDILFQSDVTNTQVSDRLIKSAWHKLNGGNVLTPTQISNLRSLTKQVAALQSESQNLVNQPSNKASQAQFKRNYLKAQRLRKQVMDELNRGGWLDIFGFAKTGSLMTLKTIIGAGGLGNAVTWAYTIPRRVGEAIYGKAFGAVLGMKNVPFLSQEAMQAKINGLLVGGEAGLKEMVTGATDGRTDYGKYYNARPWESLKRVKQDWNDNTKASVKASRVLKDLFEGLNPGSWYATGIFRALNASDKTFSTSSTMQYEVLLAKEMKVPLNVFLTDPSYEGVRAVAELLGSRDTFQNENALSRLGIALGSSPYVPSAIKRAAEKYSINENIRKAIDVLLKQNILPFTNSPINATTEALKLRYPILPLISGLARLGKAANTTNIADKIYNRTMAARDFTTATFGIALYYGVYQAIMSGMMYFTGDDDEKKNPKIRENRMFFEGAAKKMVIEVGGQKKSYKVSALGAMGMALNLIHDGIVRDLEAGEDGRDWATQVSDAIWDTQTTVRENTFLAGINQAFKATEGDKDKELDWFLRTFPANYIGAFLPAIGNQLTEMSDNEQVKRLTKDDNAMKTLYNIAIKKKLGWVSNVKKKITGEGIEVLDFEKNAPKYNLAGEKVSTNPDGEIDAFQYLFDFMEGEDYRRSKAPQKRIFLEFEKSRNAAWLPPSPGYEFKGKAYDEKNERDLKFDVRLNEELRNEYQRILGTTIFKGYKKDGYDFGGLEGLKDGTDESEPWKSFTLENVEKTYESAKKIANKVFILEYESELEKLSGAAEKKPENFVNPINR